MNPTSSLITGGVVLFGAVALANILLPAPGTAVTVHAESTVASTPDTVAPAPAVEIPAPVVPAEPLPAAAPPAVADIALPTPSLTELHEVRVKAEPKPTPHATPAQKAAAPQGFSWLVAKAKELTSSKPDAGTPEPIVATPPTVAAAADPPTTSSPTPPAGPTNASPSPAEHFAVSATLEDRAWIRIGDHRTVMAHAGDTVPGLGKVTAVGKDSITIDNSREMKVTQ